MWLILLNMMVSTAVHFPPDDSLPFSCWYQSTEADSITRLLGGAPLLLLTWIPDPIKPGAAQPGPWCTSNLSLLSNFPTDVHGGCTNHYSHTTSFSPQALLPTFSAVCVFLMVPVLTGIRLNRNIILICILLVVQCGEQFFVYLFGHLYFFWELSLLFCSIGWVFTGSLLCWAAGILVLFWCSSTCSFLLLCCKLFESPIQKDMPMLKTSTMSPYQVQLQVLN